MGTELAVAKGFEVAITTAESTPVELIETLQETLGGKLRPYDLQRIVWPSGKSTTWELPGLGGETIPAKEIVAIPILTMASRQFWERKSSGPDTSPPECKSNDGEVGEPTERGRQLGATGDCRTCPLAQWGPNNTPPACKERRELYLLLEGQYFPLVLSVPPSSIKVWRDFVKPLSLQGVAPWGTVIRLKLQTATNPTGEPYAQLKIEFVGKLEPEHKEKLRQYREVLMATFKAGLESSRAPRPTQVVAQVVEGAATPQPRTIDLDDELPEMPLEE